MKHRRYSGNDRHFGPFTYSTSDGRWRPFGLMLDSGGGDDYGDNKGCNLKLHAFGRTLIIELPPLLADYRERHVAASWDAATVARLGRNYYEEVFPREFGFTFSDKTLHVHYGPQTHDSTTTKNWVSFLPWMNWTYRGIRYYDLDGHLFDDLTQACERELGGRAWEHRERIRDRVPTVTFLIGDYDGRLIFCTTRIEERYWTFGTGAFKWLSLFRKTRVRRSLDLHFSAEVGPEKGSWKGGLIGTGIEMLPGELHEAAFRRYCENEHSAKGSRYRVKFLGVAP